MQSVMLTIVGSVETHVNSEETLCWAPAAPPWLQTTRVASTSVAWPPEPTLPESMGTAGSAKKRVTQFRIQSDPTFLTTKKLFRLIVHVEVLKFLVIGPAFIQRHCKINFRIEKLYFDTFPPFLTISASAG